MFDTLWIVLTLLQAPVPFPVTVGLPSDITAAEGRYLVIPQYAGEADDPKATDFLVPGPGKLTIKWEGANGETIEHEVFQAPSSGVATRIAS